MELDSTPWTVEGLIEVAERVMSAAPRLFSNPENESGKELNVRLIRDYVVREFIPRPERVGRESKFGREHLIWLLAVRGLLRSQRWSLPAIKASFTSTSSEELLEGLLAPVRSNIEAEFKKAAHQMKAKGSAAPIEVRTPELNPAQLLIEQFKTRKQPPTMETSTALLRSAVARKLEPDLDRMLFQRTRAEERTHIEIEPGCEVVIDAERMLALTPEEVEQLGETLKTRLRDKIAR
jgi:hypothetical protein